MMQAAGNASNTTAVAAMEDHDEKARLAAEILQIQATLEAQRLQAEIQEMEAAICASQAGPVRRKAQPTTRRVRKVRKVLRKGKRPVRQPSPEEAARQQLEQEIKATEDAILAQEEQARLTPEERVRRQLQDEIRAMESQIQKAAAEKTQIHYVTMGSQQYPESEDEFTSGSSTDNDEYTVQSCDEQTIDGSVYDEVAVVSNDYVASRPAPLNLMSAIQSAASSREQRITENGVAPPSQPPTPSNKPARSALPNLASAIQSAASERERRIKENGITIVEREPEVAASRQTTPQLSTSMAEMVVAKAADRDKRLENGGEKRMTVVKEKEEYKHDFSNICADAAKLGRLTRLNEHTVEAVAGEKTVEEEWKSSGLLAIQWRSSHMSVIHDAARAGAAAKLPETIVSNFMEEAVEYGYDDIDKPLSPRMQQLLELNQQVGAGQNKVDSLVMGRKEEQGKPDDMLVKPMSHYSSLEDVKLPKKKAPKVNSEKAKIRYRALLQAANAEHRPLTSISNEVATRAWERRTRLDRPGQTPRIVVKCKCPYCENASPFQTYAYKVKEKKAKELGYESPDSDEERLREKDEARLARRRHRQAAHGQAPLRPPARERRMSLSIRQALDETHMALPVKHHVPTTPRPAPASAQAFDAQRQQAEIIEKQAAVEAQRLQIEIQQMEALIRASANTRSVSRPAPRLTNRPANNRNGQTASSGASVVSRESMQSKRSKMSLQSTRSGLKLAAKPIPVPTSVSVATTTVLSAAAVEPKPEKAVPKIVVQTTAIGQRKGGPKKPKRGIMGKLFGGKRR
jgi:hypothetical protein